MNIVNSIELKIADRNTKKPICNLVILVTIPAHKKNDYTVGPYITNFVGEILITRKEIEEEIASSKKIFLMDYSSNLEECLPYIKVYSAKQHNIDYIIKNYTEFPDHYPDYIRKTPKLIDKLKNANKDYEDFELIIDEADLQYQGKPIVIELKKKAL